MKTLKILLGLLLAAALQPSASAADVTEKNLTNYIGCITDPLPGFPGVPAYQLVSADMIGFDRVIVWRQACLNDPTKSVILIRVVPHLPDMTLLTGSLISGIQNGSRVGPFNLLQRTRDVDGYTGYLDQSTTFILAQTSSLPVLLDENGAFQLLFMTGGAAATLDIPSKDSTLPKYLQVVEYYNNGNGHYFITADPVEMSYIDRGGAGPNWSRTGLGFRAWATTAGGGNPVCRFYGTPGIGPNSHFFSAYPAECAQTANDPGWTFEGIAFYAGMPNMEEPLPCPAQTQFVYRVYNNGYASGNSNHRYTTDLNVAQAMVNAGWIAEGATMCVPQ